MDEVKELEEVIDILKTSNISLQEELSSAQDYAAELEEQLEQAKTCINTINTAVNEITFSW